MVKELLNSDTYKDGQIVVSVIIINKNERSIENTINALKPQLTVKDELIVVDASNGNLDDIANNYNFIRWFNYSVPLGKKFSIPNQRNFGVRVARGRVIVFIDAGAIPEVDWLSKLTAPLIEGSLNVTCGPIISNKDSIYSVINDFPDGTVVKGLLTTNVAFNLDAYNFINGFDERYEYGSDADYAWRLIEAGYPPINVAGAKITMDWGSQKEQSRRSWRYGKAKARLLYYHPKERLNILKGAPELLVYTFLIFLLLFSLVTFNIKGILLVVISLLLLFIKNGFNSKSFNIIYNHFNLAISFFLEICLLFTIPKIFTGEAVLFLPKDRDRYQENLLNTLNRESVTAEYFPEWSSSKSLNLFLNPLIALMERLKGSKILHIHWLFFYNLHFVNNNFGRACLRFHFYSFILFSKLIGYRIVWTAHNVLPHSQIFDNDIKARSFLLRFCDEVIVHNEYTAKELSKFYPYFKYSVFEQGGYPAYIGKGHGEMDFNLFDYDTWRSNEVDLACIKDNIKLALKNSFSESFFVLGSIDRYKGITELLSTLVNSSSSYVERSLFIVGNCSNLELKEEIELLISQIDPAKVKVYFLSDYISIDNYELILQSEAVQLFPFKSITNSGSLIHALSRNCKIVTFDFEQFSNYKGKNLIRVPLIENINIRYLTMLEKAEGILVDAIEEKDMVILPSWDELYERYMVNYKGVLDA